MKTAGPDIVQVVPLVGVRRLGRRAFDYRVPAEQAARLGVGSVVWAPFGRRDVRGVVVDTCPTGEVSLEKVLPLRRVTDLIVPQELLRLADRLADEYLAPLGACLQAVSPPLSPGEKHSGEERFVQWVFPVDSPLTNLPLTPKQQRALAAVPNDGCPVSGVLHAAGVSRSVVEALVARGVLAVREGPRQTPKPGGFSPVDGFSAGGSSHQDTLTLTPEQATAVARLGQALCSSRPERALIWGVTGSGKTEIYLRLVEQVLEEGAGAIVLVPEIALTVQLQSRIYERVGSALAVVHSGLPPAKRAAEYDRIARGEARVVVGARSAILAPVRDLRLVVMDEAHETSYKQEEEPRYDARTVAWWRVEEAAGLLVEGTATPRIESLVGRATRIRLRERAGGGRLPAVSVVDMRREGAKGVLSPRARQALDGVLGQSEQAIVLINRRGFAGYLRCDVCAQVIMCPRCEVSLTYHRDARRLLCHQCGFQSDVPGLCPTCGQGSLARGSPGTERVVDEVRRLVPRDRLFRLDSDMVTSGTRVHDLLDAFAEARPGVLVGTQMVAKGHDFPLVTLVVVADADTGLFVPEFRAGERTFQLLTQVAGRAGRADRPGRVLVQTWNPEVDCIRMAVGGEVEAFYRRELEVRERLAYPPYRRLIRVVFACRDEHRAEAGARYVAERLGGHVDNDELRGPARLPSLRGRGRWQILLATRDENRGRQLIARALESLRVPYARRGVDVIVDVDPQWLA